MARVLCTSGAVIAVSTLLVACSGSKGSDRSVAGVVGSAGTQGSAGAAGTSAAGTGGTGGSGGRSGSAGIGGGAGALGVAGASASGGTAGDAGTAGVGGTSISTGGTGAAGEGGASGRGGGVAGGADGTGGTSELGGASGTANGGTSGSGGTGGEPCGTSTGGAAGAGLALPNFSFFVTSLGAMRALSGSQDGFGGDLRFGEVGPGAGLRGADKICATIAESSMPGSGAKGWRAFLSATTDGCGSGVVNAIDRIGNGPWYDRLGRLVAADRAALLSTRPQGDSLVVNDLPNENGVPNHMDGQPGCVRDQCPDNHDTLTGSSSNGTLWNPSLGMTCNDWTSAVGTTGRPMLGHSWPADSGMSWTEAHTAQGCAPGVHLNPGTLPMTGMTVGYGGGYGGIYCFALSP